MDREDKAIIIFYNVLEYTLAKKGIVSSLITYFIMSCYLHDG